MFCTAEDSFPTIPAEQATCPHYVDIFSVFVRDSISSWQISIIQKCRESNEVLRNQCASFLGHAYPWFPSFKANNGNRFSQTCLELIPPDKHICSLCWLQFSSLVVAGLFYLPSEEESEQRNELWLRLLLHLPIAHSMVVFIISTKVVSISHMPGMCLALSRGLSSNFPNRSLRNAFLPS